MFIRVHEISPGIWHILTRNPSMCTDSQGVGGLYCSSLLDVSKACEQALPQAMKKVDKLELSISPAFQGKCGEGNVHHILRN